MPKKSTFPEVVGADGEVRPHRRKKTERQLETLFGEVVVTRVGYSTQKPEISALYPADGQLNLSTDKYSDELRRRVATEASFVHRGAKPPRAGCRSEP